MKVISYKTKEKAREISVNTHPDRNSVRRENHSVSNGRCTKKEKMGAKIG
jgi:hypothetical protein